MFGDWQKNQNYYITIIDIVENQELRQLSRYLSEPPKFKQVNTSRLSACSRPGDVGIRQLTVIVIDFRRLRQVIVSNGARAPFFLRKLY